VLVLGGILLLFQDAGILECSIELETDRKKDDAASLPKLRSSHQSLIPSSLSTSGLT